MILELFPNEWDYVLIPDCRFPNEIDYLKEAGLDTVNLRVVRKNFKSPLTPEQQAHPSETALDDVEPDYYITNNGSMTDLELPYARIKNGTGVIQILPVPNVERCHYHFPQAACEW